MALNLFLLVLLILLTAFFVATEFAIIRLRPSRVDQLVAEGRKHALAVQKVTDNLDGYLSACQLGITITALGLGWLGEPTVEKLLHPLFESMNIPRELGGWLSFIAAFAVVTFLHVVLGELAPKSLAIQKAEKISFLTALPITFFYKVMYPFIWLLNGSANLLIRAFGLKPANEHEEAHSEEEIRIILSESYQSGMINKTEYGYVNNIFTFDELAAREIMVPRTDMVCLYTNYPLQENLDIIRRERYTRFPVASESKDRIIGIVNTKQFFLNYDHTDRFDFRALMHPALTVPDSMPIKSLLKRMQQEQVHMAILADEYGGTSGLITIEDILEEIVGEIRDEFDTDETIAIEKLGEDRYVVDGKVLLAEIDELFNTRLVNEDTDTIGGWLYMMQPELEVDEPWSYDGLSFTIREKEPHRIRTIELMKNAAGDETATDAHS